MPTIRIDDEVYSWLQSQARPFEDTPNSVLRRIARLNDSRVVESDIREKAISPIRKKAMEQYSQHGSKTPQWAFRDPLLKLLKDHQGELPRARALKELEKVMAEQLTDYDRADISSGTIRWQKSAEWEVRTMREEGLLKPVSATSRGVWALSDKGQQTVRRPG